MIIILESDMSLTNTNIDKIRIKLKKIREL